MLVTQIHYKRSVIMKKHLVVYILVALLIAVQSINVAATSIQNTDMLPFHQGWLG